MVSFNLIKVCFDGCILYCMDGVFDLDGLLYRCCGCILYCIDYAFDLDDLEVLFALLLD